MKKIFSEIAAIDQSLLDLQNTLAKINSDKRQYESDIASRKQLAEQTYSREVERIQKQRTLVESERARLMADCAERRLEAERDFRAEYAERAREIINNCSLIKRRNEQIIAWIEHTIAEMPPRIVKRVVAGPTIHPALSSKDELENIYNKIFDSSFHAKTSRAFHKDGYSPKTKMIESFVKKAIAYKLYLESEIKGLAAGKETREQNAFQIARNQMYREHKQIGMQESNIEKTARQRFSVLDQQVTNAREARSAALQSIEQTRIQYERDLDVRRNNFVAKRNSVIGSQLIVQFTDRIRNALVGTGVSKTDWTAYDPKKKHTEYWIGNLLYPIKTTETQLLSALQAKNPQVFKGGSFAVPLILRVGEPSKFFVHYQQFDRNAVCEFVQYIILQRLRCAEVGNIELYLAEPDKSGRILGPLSAKIEDNVDIGIYNINSRDAIHKTLKSIADSIDGINGLLGSYNNIYEYNLKCKPHIKERCLVLVDVVGVIEKEDWELLKVIWNNSARCGVTIIFLSAYSAESLSAQHPHMNIDFGFFNTNDSYLIKCVNNSCSLKSGQSLYGFMPSKIADHHRSFGALYRNAAKSFLTVDNRFSVFFDSTKAYQYKTYKAGESKEKIELPVMLRNYPGGGIFNLVMDSSSPKTHTLVTGGIGTGKTTFLHMIISAIVMKYHPDDVEIWLVDYARSSFAEYAMNRPKHIRLVGLEKTKSFTYSFLDYVDDFFNKRSLLFKREGINTLEEYRAAHGDLSMPHVVLIVDEFHYMTQHANDDFKYKKILENILRDYRKYGLSCVFSDQSSHTGLTDVGEKQIANRFTMKQHSVQDMIDTLGIAKSNYSDSMIHQMEQTAKGELWGVTDSGNSRPDMKVEFFKAIYVTEAERKQLIATSLRRKEAVKCDTKVLIVDGEDRKPAAVSEIISELSNFRKTAALDPVFCVGVPTGIEPYYCFSLEQRSNNNILVAGRSNKIACDVLSGLLLSAAIMKKNKILIFADPREKSLPDVVSVAKRVGFASRIEVCTEYEAMCSKIKTYSDRVKNRVRISDPTLIMWMGMLDIFDELSGYDDYEDQSRQQTGTEQDGFELSSANASAAIVDKELMAIVAQLGDGVGDVMQRLSQAPGKPASASQPKKSSIYNAISDINTIFARGSNFCLHSIVVLENSSDLKRLKGFKTEYFLHKIAYKMSRDDSWDFGFGSDACDIESDEVALYTNGIDKCTFRSFLFK